MRDQRLLSEMHAEPSTRRTAFLLFPTCTANGKYGVVMREQIGHPYRQPGQGQRIQRQSLIPQTSASRHRVGHQAGLHPEDTPYLTGQTQQPAQTYVEDEIEEDERYYTTRKPTSAIRYQTTGEEQLIRQGNKRFIVHQESPPVRQQLLAPPRQRDEEAPEPWHGTRRRFRFHPLVFIGFALLLMLAGWVAVTALGTFWQAKQDDWTYGQSPRTYQTDAVVGHSDSSSSPSHFIALNNKGHIIIVEFPGGDATRARSYTITTIPGNDGNPPVKVTFQDLNRDGKLDMLIQIGDPGSVVTIILFNNGTQFVSKL
jgi:hypothetical protein